MSKSISRKNRRRVAASCIEVLEQRQLLSLTIDVRDTNGGKSSQVTPGEVLHLQAFAVITGQNADPSQDAFQSCQGSFLSTVVGFQGVGGDLSIVTPQAPFNASIRSSSGKVQDLNGDGNADVGTNDNMDVTDIVSMAAAAPESNGTPVGGSLEFFIGTFKYTVTNIHLGGETDINFRPFTPPAAFDIPAIWTEDNTGANPDSSPFQAGAPYVIMDTAAQPSGPQAIDDSFHTTSNSSNVVEDVLANDGDFTGSLVRSSLTITSQPDHGGTVTIDPNTFDVIYTPAPTFAGTEQFQYTVADDHSAVSTPGTVTFTVAPTPPVAANDSASTSLGQSVTIPVLSNDTTSGGFDLTSIAVASGPSHGTAVPDGQGNVIYTPASGFVGADSFTYTFKDTFGSTSTAATVNVSTVLQITSNAGGNRSLTYTDTDGTKSTITLSRGTADISFSTGATATVDRLHRVTLSGASTLSGLTLSGTTSASALTITGRGGDNLAAIGSITDASTLGRIIATDGFLTGNLSVNGASLVQLKSASGATITIGNGIAAGASLILTNATNSSVTSSVPLRLILRQFLERHRRDNQHPSIGVMVIAGTFDPQVTLTGTGNNTPALSVANVTGNIAGNWNITGNTNSIVAGTADGSGGAINVSGNVNAFTVRRGMGGNLLAGGIGVLTVIGPLTGSINAGSARLIHVTGGITNSTLDFTGPASGNIALGTLIVGGAISNSNILATGNVTTIVAQSMDTSHISVGTQAGVTLSNASAANLGGNALNSVVVIGSYSNSTILAHKIGVASLGIVNTATPLGLAAVSFRTLIGKFSGKLLIAPPSEWTNQATFDSFVQSKGVVFGDFEIVIAV